ncbi:MAG: gamma carbonic anhydrase family protein [bacterium]|nr:gamma carbonic anhydrase family protein [bacterium]
MTIQNPNGLALPASLFGGGLVMPWQEFAPAIGEDVFLAPNTSVIGRVKLGDRVSIWFGSTLRGDIARVEVGAGSNIQDNSILHVGDDDPCLVGAHVNVGHGVVLHGCTVEDDCNIGMAAVIINKAVIGRGSVVGAGALVTQGTIIPPYSLVLGAPAKVRRELTPEERAHHAIFAPKYTMVAAKYRPLFNK